MLVSVLGVVKEVLLEHPDVVGVPDAALERVAAEDDAAVRGTPVEEPPGELPPPQVVAFVA